MSSTLRLDAGGEAFREAVSDHVKSQFRPVLVVLDGVRVGDRIVVEGNALVGRDPAAELCLGDAGVSWHHAYIEDRGGSWAVVDAQSTNGTCVNGEVVTEAPLTHGDKLVFGSTLVRFELQDAADRAYDEFVTRLVSIDDLTGLLLRRRFDRELDRLLDEARLRQAPVGMLVMDLDGVKAINDEHGHAFGAYVISEAGRLIGAAVGARGIACRWGGDEYLAALTGLDRSAAIDVAEAIRLAIERHRFERDGVCLIPRISIGVAVFPDHASNRELLFERADVALYQAKRAGKNRVCAFAAAD